MRSVFVGAVEGSAVALTTMCKAGFSPELVVTLPPELGHRHSDFADLAPIAEDHGIAVRHTPKSDSADTIAAIAGCDPDVVFVIGWSQLCGDEFRSVPRLGCIGFHPSALPRLRGRGVIPWTILLGEREAGATLFWLGQGADDGPIAAQELFSIDPEIITARALYDKVLAAMERMLPGLLEGLSRGEVPSRPQPSEGVSVCARRRPEDGRIDWSRPAAEVHRLIRAVGPPYPGAFTFTRDGERLVLVAVRHTAPDGYYIGLPGQVQAHGADGFVVACGDGRCLDILDWTGPDAPPAIHSMLGDFSP